MTTSPSSAWKEKSLSWLKNDVFPLWLAQGIEKMGSFVESLDRNAEPLQVPKRSMVQARQIYSFCEAQRMEILASDAVKPIVKNAVWFFIKNYSTPQGGFYHSIDVEGRPASDQVDLYSQSFALFGLANAYDLLRDPALKERANVLVDYLKTHRSLDEGGYSEVIGGQTLFQSNPHMHLFEAAIAWMKVDDDVIWKNLANDVFRLAQTRFIDSETGALCEHFGPGWEPKRESGKFFFEPGHHYEWAWLMEQFAAISGVNVSVLSQGLFRVSEKYGVNSQTGFVFDEVWSDKSVKKKSSRFWPQTERIKAAVALGEGSAADQALAVLFSYFSGLKPGLWEDTLAEDGKFIVQPVKASSLYHIINAMSEYVSKR